MRTIVMRWIECLSALALVGTSCAHDHAAAPPATTTAVATPPAAAKPTEPAPPAPLAHPPFARLAAVDVPDLRFDYTPEQLDQACADAEHAVDAKLAEIVAIPDAQRTFANSFGAAEQALADYGAASGRLAFLKESHPDAKGRGPRRAARRVRARTSSSSAHARTSTSR